MRNSRIERSQATTMTIRNRNGLTHAALNAFATAFWPLASATLRSLYSLIVAAAKLTRWINTVQRVSCNTTTYESRPGERRAQIERRTGREAARPLSPLFAG